MVNSGILRYGILVGSLVDSAKEIAARSEEFWSVTTRLP